MKNHPAKFFKFGVGPDDFTDRSVTGVNDAGRAGKPTLISGAGLAPFSPALAATKTTRQGE